MIHKHDPVPKEEMGYVSPRDTICETLRQAYQDSKNENVKYLLRVATAKAKAMSRKLSEYNRNANLGLWRDNAKYRNRKKSIDVLFLCYDDNANTGFRFFQCAKYLGLNAVMFKGKVHPFYSVQAPLHPSLSNTPISTSPIMVPAPGLESLVLSSHVVHLIASTYPIMAVDWKKVNVVVQHGGTVYRQNPKACNNAFNPMAKKTVIQCPDLLDLGAKDEEWIYYPVDMNLFKHDFSMKDPYNIVVGHFPSNVDNKGTDRIESAIKFAKNAGAPIEYVGDTNRVSWRQNLKRMAQCDVIVEGCNASQQGKVYGEWGNTALEASSLGCGVITHSLSYKRYHKEFGDFAPLIANDTDSLIKRLVGLDRKNVQELKEKCYKWAVKKHSIPVTANRLWDRVYKDFF
jgi:hypothetical protein